MIYRVLVKKPTRKGSEILVDRVVESSGTKYEVQNVLAKSYFGLIVEAEPVESVDAVSVEKVEDKKTLPVKKISTVDITVEFTSSELELIKEWKKLIESASLVRSEIERSVKSRYEPKYEFLGYCDGVNLRLGEIYATPKITVRLRNCIEETVVGIDENMQPGNDLS